MFRAPRALPLAASAFARSFSRRSARARRPDANIAVMLAALKHAHEAALAVADARLKEMGERLDEVKAAAAERVAGALYDLDVARGILGARPLLEQSLLELRRRTARGGDGERSGGSKGAMAQVIDELLPAKAGAASSCPGLIAYLTVAAEDNAMSPEQVLRSAKELYSDLSKASHSAPIGMPSQLPEELFIGWGAESRLAFEAIVTFSGRRMSFYYNYMPRLNSRHQAPRDG